MKNHTIKSNERLINRGAIAVYRNSLGFGLLLACTLATWTAATVNGDTLTITGAGPPDCTVIVSPDEWTRTGHENFGSLDVTQVFEQDGIGWVNRTLLRFDLPELESVHVISATVTLRRNDWLSNEGMVSIYRLLESWTEGTGAGVVQDGAADWFDRQHGVAAWSTTGALGPGSSLTVPTDVHTVQGEYTFSLDVTADVQYWYDNGLDVTNFGWVLTSIDTDGQHRFGLRLWSDDSLSAPVLTIEYVPNLAPIAVCQGAVVAVGEVPDIDGGSYDPDGDEITLSQNPAGAFSEAGIYEAMLTVSDPDGATDSCTAMVVVFDPSTGFVTGGGWIDSPEGALPFDPTLTGKANFGFVSKYKKGASIPTGNTEFQFHTGGLNFHSSSYDWLVVTGSSYAKFKGTGTILDVPGEYKFMLWAGDSEPDTFRIRIWVENEETTEEIVIYDNGNDQSIGGGNIIVHTGKK